MLRGPGPFGDLADDAAAGSAGNFLLDRADAEVGRGRERLNLADDALWRTGPPKMPAARLSGPHTGGDALADERRFQLGHGADDGEHGAAHGAVRVDLVLNAYKAHPEVVEFLKCRQQVARAAGEAVELPHQHAVDLLVARGRHQSVELGPGPPCAPTRPRRSSPARRRAQRAWHKRVGRRTAGPASGRRSRPAGRGRCGCPGAVLASGACVQKGIHSWTPNGYLLLIRPGRS